MSMQEIKKYAQNNGYDDVKFLGQWKEYDVYQLIFTDDEAHFIGYPQYILIKDNFMEIITDFELEISNYKF